MDNSLLVCLQDVEEWGGGHNDSVETEDVILESRGRRGGYSQRPMGAVRLT